LFIYLSIRKISYENLVYEYIYNKNIHMKKCTKCKQVKELSLFFKDKQKKDNLGSQCKECVTKQTTEYVKNNRENARFNQLKFVTGVDKKLYLDFLSLQNNKCAICRIEFGTTKKKFSIDHCHKTDLIRGLLCARCNFGIGYFLDDISLLQNAIEYLQNNLSYKGLKMKK
jgi:hypothetical protein